MGVKTIEGSDTPLSGWHFVCPCGWTIHDKSEPLLQKVRAHRLGHAIDIIAMRRGQS